MTLRARTRRRVCAWACVALALPVFHAAQARAEDPRTRWPRWPSEVSTLTEPLYAEGATEGAQMRALADLEPFADPVVERHVERALALESPIVRQTALRMCAQRSLRVCLDAAMRMSEDGLDFHTRAAALEVLAIEPDGLRLDRLLRGLSSQQDGERAACAQLLGRASLSPAARIEVKKRLIGKLGDLSAEVRAAVAGSLGLLRAHEAAPALVRALSDPDPGVVEAAASALADLEDERALAALARLAENSVDGDLIRLSVRAVGRIPGVEAEAQLLRWLEARPPKIPGDRLILALGLRTPTESLVAELVFRLRIEAVAGDAERALRLLGPGAWPLLSAHLHESTEASVRARLQSLLAHAHGDDPTGTVGPTISAGSDGAEPAAPADAGDRAVGSWFDRVRDRIDRGDPIGANPAAPSSTAASERAAARAVSQALGRVIAAGGVRADEALAVLAITPISPRQRRGMDARHAAARAAALVVRDGTPPGRRLLAALALANLDPTADALDPAAIHGDAARRLALTAGVLRAAELSPSRSTHGRATIAARLGMRDPDPRVRVTTLAYLPAELFARAEVRCDATALADADPDPRVRAWGAHLTASRASTPRGRQRAPRTLLLAAAEDAEYNELPRGWVAPAGLGGLVAPTTDALRVAIVPGSPR